MKIVFLCLCCAIAAPLLLAQTAPAPLTNGPTPPARLDPAAATRAWLDSVPAEKRAQSDAYFEGGYWLILWEFLLGAAISVLLLESRLSARLRDLAERTTRSKSLQVALYAVAHAVIVALLSFPLSVYSGYFREHAYGLATGFGAMSGILVHTSLVAVGIFNFLGLWNQYLLPLVLNPDPDRYVLAQGLAALSVSQGYRSDWSGLFAGLTIAMLPVLVAYVAFQRHIRSGMTAGAVR